MVIKLIGRSIGFTTLLNRIQLLLKLDSPLQLMDLDNNFYLVRFGDKRDMERVLTDGPWVLFGHCLSVQCWTPSFSTDSNVFDSLVVWICLLALLECYYLGCLLRVIG